MAMNVDWSRFPTLDEMWSLYVKERHPSPPPQFEAMRRYAEDARQGLWPDRVKPEQAIQAVYLALAQDFLLSNPPRREQFLIDVFAFFDSIAAKLIAGAKLLDEPLIDAA